MVRFIKNEEKRGRDGTLILCDGNILRIFIASGFTSTSHFVVNGWVEIRLENLVETSSSSTLMRYYMARPIYIYIYIYIFIYFKNT